MTSTKAEAVEQLDALARASVPLGAHLGVVPPRAPRIAFLFSGQGGQYAGMTRSLYETQPRFRELIDECDALLRPQLAQPLLSVLHPADAAASPIHETAYTQPALFAVEYALAKLGRASVYSRRQCSSQPRGARRRLRRRVLSLKDALMLVAERGD